VGFARRRLLASGSDSHLCGGRRQTLSDTAQGLAPEVLTRSRKTIAVRAPGAWIATRGCMDGWRSGSFSCRRLWKARRSIGTRPQEARGLILGLSFFIFSYSVGGFDHFLITSFLTLATGTRVLCASREPIESGAWHPTCFGRGSLGLRYSIRHHLDDHEILTFGVLFDLTCRQTGACTVFFIFSIFLPF
jgi:hypothetical protein